MASIRRRGSVIQASIRRKGYRPIYKTFDDTDAGWQEAEQWAEDIELQIKRNRYVESSGLEKTPLRDALRRYQREVVQHMKARKSHTSRVNLLLSMPLTDRAMCDVSSMLIATWRDELLESGYSASSVKILMGILSKVYGIAISEWGVPVTNPVKQVRRPRENAGRERRITPEEEAALLDHLGEPFNSQVLLLLETAMRRGELYRLTWREINLLGRYAVLRDTKNGENRSVPLSTKAMSILTSLPRNISGPVFSGHPDSLTHAFADACNLAGIKDLRLHDLRHEAISRLFELGTLGIMEVASITGHRDLTMLRRYTHMSASKLAAKLG